MHYFIENPWPFMIACGVAAAACLIALRATQQGKFLVGAAIAAALAGFAWLADALVVTDAERVEAVVYGMVDAVRKVNPAPDPESKASPGDRDKVDTGPVFEYLTKDVTLESGERSLPSLISRALIQSELQNTRFDFLNVGQVEVQVAPQSRTAKARFRAHAGGTTERASYRYNFLTDGQGTDWEFGLREEAPNTWKIMRITAVRLPRQANIPGL
ncbi:MAG: hypothetical protein U0800_03495 [Isosphaeraceae bacterium]